MNNIANGKHHHANGKHHHAKVMSNHANGKHHHANGKHHHANGKHRCTLGGLVFFIIFAFVFNLICMKNLLGDNKYPLSVDTAVETIAILLGEARNERYLKTVQYSTAELLDLDTLIDRLSEEKDVIYGLNRSKNRCNEEEQLNFEKKRMDLFLKVKNEYCPTLKERTQTIKKKSTSASSRSSKRFEKSIHTRSRRYFIIDLKRKRSTYVSLRSSKKFEERTEMKLKTFLIEDFKKKKKISSL